MKVGPILFKPAMVRGLLSEQKTQTRRIASPRNMQVDVKWSDLDWASPDVFVDPGPSPIGNRGPYLKVPHRDGETVHRVYPRYLPGDLLWVRESGVKTKQTFSDWGAIFRHDVPATSEIGYYWVEKRRGPGASYSVAGCSRAAHLKSPRTKPCPSLFMPRWASRLTLEVVDVRVQHLHEMTEADAAAEGIDLWVAESLGHGCRPSQIATEVTYGSRVQAFAHLWDTINGMDAFNSNPWVVALTFKTHHCNIDELLKQREVA